jgi:hypothetical protein
LRSAEGLILRTQTGLDKTPCINRTLAVHDLNYWYGQVPGAGCSVYNPNTPDLWGRVRRGSLLRATVPAH